MPDPAKLPWYADGLKFKCTGCGDCCTGAPGYVWVNNAEIAALAELVGVSIAELERRFVKSVGVRKSLKERRDGACVFFDDDTRKCTVYSARPRQCRTWPFWESNVRTEAAWKETCEACPGSGVGRLYTLEEMNERLRVIRI